MRIAFVGLGAMGGRMARRLLDAGHELVVWNRDAEKAEPLVGAGAGAADSPAAAARGAGAVVLMISDPGALREVTEGPSGALAGVGEGCVVVQMATVGPAATERLAAALPAGVALVDAPVLGTLPHAEEGRLRIFAGAGVHDLERVEPLLSVLGTVMRVGGVGAGSAAKLVANSTLFGVLGVLGEALALADALGLSRETAFELLAATPVAEQAARRRPAVESGEYPPHFSLRLALKDAELVREAAAAAALDLRVAEAARSWLADADAAGRGDEDYSVVLEQISGGRTS